MKVTKQILIINNWNEFIANSKKYQNDKEIISLEDASKFKLDWRIESREVDEKCCAIFSGKEIFD